MNAIKLSRLKQACLILIYGMFSKFMPQVPTSRLNGRKMTVTTASNFMIGYIRWLVTGRRGVPGTGIRRCGYGTGKSWYIKEIGRLPG